MPRSRPAATEWAARPTRAARTLFPAIRWDPVQGFASAAPGIEMALGLGVGGFVLFGGPAAAISELTAALRTRSAAPLLIGADLERGAGQQFTGAVSLPPAGALGAIGDLEATRRAGELTGREARALGVDWVYAPVADLDVEPANPIVGTRSYGADPVAVSAHVGAWIDGCRSAGTLTCAKHFPGHGRTVTDSHLGLPVVGAARAVLDADLRPFRAALEHRVDAVMTAHVAYPALDPGGRPATLSPAIVTGLLRGELDFQGLVVTDALVMAGVLQSHGDESQAAVAALAAGCDALLCPADPERVAAALESVRGRTVPEARMAEAVRRVEESADRVASGRGEPGWGRPPGWGHPEDRQWARELGMRALRPIRGQPAIQSRRVHLVTVDDDLGGPFPPGPRTAFPATLLASAIEVSDGQPSGTGHATVVALYADIRGWKGRPHVSGAARQQIEQALAVQPHATVVLFGHPRLAEQVPGRAVLGAWSGDQVMQEAAARWLADRAR